MKEIIGFAILGLGAGGLYVLGAFGIVLVYRGSGVINFAQGAIATVAAYVFWQLHTVHGVSLPLAFIAGVAASTLLGILMHVMLTARLQNASLLTKLIATLAVLSIIQAALALEYPTETNIVSPILPGGSWNLWNIQIVHDQVVIIGIVVVAMVVLWWVYKHTTFGLWTSAVSEDREVAAGAGISPNMVAGVNWGIGAGLAGVAGILLAPIVGLSVTAYTALVIPMLAAAVLGRFVSFPLTLVGGLVIGIAESEVTRYGPSDVSGLAQAVPFVLVAIVLLARGTSISLRGAVAARLPSIGSGRVSLPIVGFGIAVALVLLWTTSPDWVAAITTLIVIATILLSVVIVTGYAGQLSLAQFAFSGIGALVAGLLVGLHGWPVWAGWLAGTLVAMPVGLVVGLAGVRTRGLNLAIVTMGFAVAIDAVVMENLNWTGGFAGISVPRVVLFGVDITPVTYPARYGTVCLIILVIAALVTANIRRGGVGRRLIAVRGNERASASLGISVVGAKLFAFTLAAGIASIGGILFEFTGSTLTYNNGEFGVMQSITVLQEAVVGGVGWIGGSVIGGTIQPGSVGSQALSLLGEDADKYVLLAGGVLLLLTLLLAPNGAAAQQAELFASIKARLARLAGLVRKRQRRASSGPEIASGLVDMGAERGEAPVRCTPKVLEVKDLTVRYGGVTALDRLSLRVEPGGVTGLIGPNGAGKTTLLDALSGFAPVASGSLVLDGADIGSLSPAQRSLSGMSRCFQSLELFSDMTVFENIAVAAESRDRFAYVRDLVWPRRLTASPKALSAVRTLGLEPDLLKLPGELPHGRQRLAAIARALAGNPSILLLDEPAAGLDDHETRQLGRTIREMAKEWGIGVLLIEHDVNMVLSVSDIVYVVDFGKPIANGKPDVVRADQAVIDAYLGSDFDSEVEEEVSGHSVGDPS